MPLLPVLGQVRFVVEAGSNFSEVGPQYKSCCCLWSLLNRTPSKLATYEKHFFSERLPISQLLPQENTINSSVMRALIHTQFSYGLCASSYHRCPRQLTCMEQKTEPGRLFPISIPWLTEKLREIIVLAILLGKSFYELGLTKCVKIPNVQLL